jgi:hypothetical protein
MKNIFLFLLCCCFYAGRTQTYLSFTLINSEAREKRSFFQLKPESSASFETGSAIQHIFSRKSRPEGKAISVTVQGMMGTAYGASGFSLSRIRLPVTFAVHTPHIGYKDHPLFDGHLGFGYFFDFPFSSNYSNDPYSLKFTGHGFVIDAGISLYTIQMGKIDLSLFNTFALGAIKNWNYPDGLTPPIFNTYGLKLGYGGNLKKVLSRRKNRGRQ